MKIVKLITTIGCVMVAVFAHADEDVWLEHDITPSAIDLQLKGAEEVSGQNLLIAGTNVTALITLKDFSEDWVRWRKMMDACVSGPNSIVGVGGRSRHVFEGVIVKGYPAQEIVLTDELAGYDENGKVYAHAFKEGAYLSAAKENIEFIAYVDPDKETEWLDPQICTSELKVIPVGPVSRADNEYCYNVQAEFKLPIGSGRHGQYYWTVTTLFTHEYETFTFYADGSVVTNGPMTMFAQLTPHPDTAWRDFREIFLVTNEMGRVFFDKDGKDDGKTPNWFAYWGEDGAVPQLRQDVSFSKVPSFDSLFTIGGEYNLIQHEGDGWGGYDFQNKKITLHDDAGDAHYYGTKIKGSKYKYEIRSRNQSMPTNISQFWDPIVFGIYTCESVIAHESQHGKMDEEYKAAIGEKLYEALFGKWAFEWHVFENGEWKWKSPEPSEDVLLVRDTYDSDLTMNVHIDDGWQGETYSWSVKMTNYGTAIKKNEQCHCDRLTDTMETGKYAEYKLNPQKLDTYNLGFYKGREYESYGDNEYLAMVAGFNAVHNYSRVCETNDWSFPGHQSYLPYPFERKDGTCSPIAANLVKGPSSLLTANASLKSSAGETDSENPGELSCSYLAMKFRNGATEGKYAGVECEFRFDVVGTNKVEIIGYLSDLNSNVVARAMLRQEFTPTNNSCTLFFDGREINESGKDGPYMLLGLVFREYDDLDVYFHSAVSGFNIPNVEATHDDFIRADVEIVNDTVVENVSEEGIVLGIDVVSQSVGRNELVINVATTNGTSLGRYWQSLACVAGTNHYEIVISADMIRARGQNGPYVITKAIVQHEQVNIDKVTNLYVTAMEDFATYYGFGGDDPEEPDDPDAQLSQTIGDYTWYYSVVGDGVAIQKIVDYGFISWGECAIDPVPTGDIELPASLGGKNVVGVGESAFEDCDELTSVVISACVTNIGASAFYGCSSLTNLTFEGNAPEVGEYAFSGVDYYCTVTVYEDATGWDDDEDGYWNDLEIVYREREAIPDGPSVPGDPDATVVGDAASGYTIIPSAGKTEVEVTIPSGVAAENVTVEIGTDVTSIKPNGATVRIKNGTNDITRYLVLPAADSNGTIDLTKAAVKADIVKETLDPEKGAVITLNADSPSLTTSETKPGLTYTLKEGSTIKGMGTGDSKVGDGKAWTPNITVKGGASGFYSIDVTK